MCKKHHTSVICPNSHQFILVIFSDVQTENLHQWLALQLSVCIQFTIYALIYNDEGNLWRGACQDSSAQPKVTLRPS